MSFTSQTPQPILAWNFDGSTTSYIGGVSPTVTNGTVSYQAGIYGQAFYINGSTSNVIYSVPDIPVMTMCFWWNPTSTSAGNLLDMSSVTSGTVTNDRINVTLDGSGRLVVNFSPITSWNSPTLGNGGWYHIAIVATNTSYSTYFNGIFQTTVTASFPTITTYGRNLSIGCLVDGTGTAGDGLLDDLCIYNKVLTAAQVLLIYNAKGIRRSVVTNVPTVFSPITIGGAVSYVGGQQVITFAISSGNTTLQVLRGGYVRILIIAGGGGGGGNIYSTTPTNVNGGGGGGAGEVYYASSYYLAADNYTITIGGGAGGGGWATSVPGRGGTGASTSFIGSLGVNITVAGGGGGGAGTSTNRNGANGGSGGGAGLTAVATSSVTTGGGLGNGGGAGHTVSGQQGGGGGGAGSAGSQGGVAPAGGARGAGFSTDISGTTVVYGQGGVGGNGGVALAQGGTATSGDAGTGTGGNGGQGGTRIRGNNGGSGGSGIIIISYPFQYPYLATMKGAPILVQLSPAASASCTGAYSLASVNSTSSKVIQVRRSTDNVLQDFYANRLGGSLLTTPISGTRIADWLGGATGYVTIWYDQAGSNNATQTNTSLQPKIDYSNNQIDFKTSAYFNLPNGTVPYGNSNYTMIVKHNTITSPGCIVGSGTYGITSNTNALEYDSSVGYKNFWWNNDITGGTYAANNTVSAVYDNTIGRTLYVNGNSVNTNANTNRNSGTNQNTIGTDLRSNQGQGSNHVLNGELYYMFLFNSALNYTDRNLIEGSYLYAFTTFTFTTLGTTGPKGPLSLSGYSGNYPGAGTSSALYLVNGIQYWTVPKTGSYTFTVAGAGSFSSISVDPVNAGNGAVLTATYTLNQNQLIGILVGQKGIYNGDGGGGTFVASGTTPLFVAGGAGGIGYETGANGNVNGSLNTSGKDGLFFAPTQAGTGGTNGGGGAVATSGNFNRNDAGAGFYGNGGAAGTASLTSKAFVNGGYGSLNGQGSAGFGGASCSGNFPSANRTGGAGGGYSGGGNGSAAGQGRGGGGGGSYDITGVYSATATNLNAAGYVTVTLN